MAFGCDKKFGKTIRHVLVPLWPDFQIEFSERNKKMNPKKKSFFFIVTMLLVELELIKTFEIDKT